MKDIDTTPIALAMIICCYLMTNCKKEGYKHELRKLGIEQPNEKGE